MGRAALRTIQAAAGAGGGDFYSYTIDNSARFAGSETLYRTWGTPTNNKKWTFSTWFKLDKATSWAGIFGAGNYNNLYINSNRFILIQNNPGPYGYRVDRFIRDPGAWMHVVIAFDSTQATASDRQKMYINGVQQDTTLQYSAWPLNVEPYINKSGYTHYIGRSAEVATYSKQYLAECVFIDGQQLDATSFGESKNGTWIPKEITGLTFGNNGFHLKFDNASSLGTDSSGNSNNFSVTGLTSSDQMPDTPTNNMPTLNPLLQYTTAAGYTGLMANGNLEKQGPADNSFTGAYSTISMAPNTGKWYSEHYLVTENRNAFGISYAPTDAGSSTPNDSTVYGYYVFTYSGWTYSTIYATSSDSSPQTITNVNSGSIVGVLYDSDALEVTFYVNGSQAGTTVSVPEKTYVFFSDGYGVSPQTYQVSNFGQDSTFGGRTTAGGNSDANDIGDFKYTVPTDAKALCTANLPEPAIGPNSSTQSDEHFNTVLWTGTGATNNITGVGFQPDWVWIKQRSSAQNNVLHDAVRGAGNYLMTDSTNVEATNTNQLSSFDSDGFTVGTATSTNQSGSTYVAWNWKGNGSGSSNTDGSITTTLSANADAGIAIMTYTGNATAGATLGHGLGVAPKMAIFRRRSPAVDWYVYHEALGVSSKLKLNTTGASSASTDWNSTAPGSSVFTIGSGGGVNTSGSSYVAYMFAEIEGFSKFGSFAGKSGAEFVYTGFRPAFVMTKRTNSSGWYMFDDKRGYNGGIKSLQPNTSNAEAGPWTQFSIFSNGFEDNGFVGDAGTTIIYMAFAENPFKYANAR